jgi:hypothetical protein
MFVTRGIVSCCIVAEVMGPSYLQVPMYPEIRPEFLSPELRTKLILPWNDLIPTCVPMESSDAAEFRGFQKMTPSRNRNTKRNAHPRRGGPLENDGIWLSGNTATDHDVDTIAILSNKFVRRHAILAMHLRVLREIGPIVFEVDGEGE